MVLIPLDFQSSPDPSLVFLSVYRIVGSMFVGDHGVAV